ncbi:MULTISPECIES: outer membrane beta-barrel protein [Falsihalocynthiibacter]|uniref:outer membrane beta-barrel protein n=1 Tax=Falsihalocynthiibacter TaxID=2854182 RepID=UPI003001A18F
MRIAVISALCIASVTATQAAAQDWSAEVYGGGTFEGDLAVGGTDEKVDSGTTYGGGLYYSGLGGMDALELGFDLSRTNADYKTSGEDLQSTAAMAIARYSFVNSGPLKAYGALGLGWVETASAGDEDSGLGGRAALGISYDVSETIGVFGEVRHTRAFDSSTLNGVSGIENRNNAVVVGLSTQF